MSLPSSRSSSSSSSRNSLKRQSTKKRSTIGQLRGPFHVLSSTVTKTALFVVAAAMVAAASAQDIIGAANEANPTAHEAVFKNVTGLIRHAASSSTDARKRNGDRRRGLRSSAGLTKNGEKCSENMLWSRRVDAVDYEYGCKEIEEMMTGMTLIGEGWIRTVYLAEYGGRKVAVKTLRHMDNLTSQKKHLKMHMREVLTLDALRGHPNIVNMLGICGTTVVTEFYGDSFLAQIHRNGKELPIRRVVSLALDVIRGLQVMHEVVGGVHMDMKPQQLLIDDTGHGKVNDFNSIHLMNTQPGVQGAFCPTQAGQPVRMVPWRSPENVAGKPVTDKTDVYSMGMIFYSLINGDTPYETPESFKLALVNKSRPEIDPSWHEGFMEIVKSMWHEDPEERPSARIVVAKLESLLHELP